MTDGFPVFYDQSGKRLHHFVIGTVVVLCALAGAVAYLAPAALAPTRVAQSDDHFARRFLATGDSSRIPAVGDTRDGVMTRLVTVVREHPGSGAAPGPDALDGAGYWGWWERDAAPPPMPRLKLVDAVTGDYLRDANEFERENIGDSPYAIEHFGRPPDKTLMLTFDDGPDARWTPRILDVLARNHVPATFFVIGSNVARQPEIFRRMIREGHMVGNHTLSHLDFNQQNDFRNQEELIATDRIMRAEGHYSSPLFRIPKGDPDHNGLAQLQSQSLGYLQVDMDVDTDDWRHPPGQDVPVPPLDGRGHVVLLHDGGGDRSATVAMLEMLIGQARAQGYTFTTLEPMLPQHYLPQKNIQPVVADRVTAFVAYALWVAPGRLLGGLFWFGSGSLVIMSGLYLLLALLTQWRQRRRCWPDLEDHALPYVSVVLAAYNEANVIARTVAVLRDSDYPASRYEVVAVDDGSTDNTAEILDICALEWSRLTVVHQENSGKSSALNNGINHTAARSTVIVTMDADTLFRRATIRNLARHFVGHHNVGAVAGHVKVGNRRNIITAWQSLEYISGICVTRMAEMSMGAISIAPGACSAWRRVALQRIGGFCDDTLAEDADATLSLQKLGYAVVNENEAICDTEAPETVRALAKQRKRWTFGNIQALWKHRGMLLRPKYGMLGMVTLPYAAVSLIFPIVFLPLTVVVAALSLAEGNWRSIALFAVFVAVVHGIIATTGVVIAREKAWHLAVVPIYRLIYEPLRFYLLYASTWRVIKGTVVAWDKLERRNTVVAADAVGRNDLEEYLDRRVAAVVGIGIGAERGLRLLDRPA
ncbi:polysaccharide deacetylase [Mycolicibacterium porcinum]|uniref:bifunctional polysaccharide deacetylase/glycosyltransferase family 2 protein n=1 Tax=Mycolicibacterium porcinum TaxID=39693 RepID=UPI00080BE6EA|nr:bifunctional polysaccharide deacetylase/glycosyltransferase family 2 protein [Mycolicibacterium porcinum]OCB10713.1 polysaccharide deacetylase [Mycolicibacterium porcinum]